MVTIKICGGCDDDGENLIQTVVLLRLLQYVSFTFFAQSIIQKYSNTVIV